MNSKYEKKVLPSIQAQYFTIAVTNLIQTLAQIDETQCFLW
jgi:hypothetical protein